MSQFVGGAVYRGARQCTDHVQMDGTKQQVAKTNKRLDWCHKGQTPPVLLRIEEEEEQAMELLAGKGKKGSKKSSKVTATKKRLR